MNGLSVDPVVTDGFGIEPALSDGTLSVKLSGTGDMAAAARLKGYVKELEGEVARLSIGAVEFDPIPDAPGRRAHERFIEAFNQGLLVRATGDIIALSPPLIIDKRQIDQLFDIFSRVLKTVN